MRNKIIYIATVFIIALTSCKAGDVEKSSGRLVIDAPVSNTTEVNEIGFFVLNPQGSIYDDCDCYVNNKVSYSKNGWQIERETWLSQQVATVYAYSPFNSEVSDLKEIPVTSISQIAYQVSSPVKADALSPYVTLELSPVLASLKLKLKKQGYVGVGHVSGISLQGIGTSGTVNLIDKSLTTLTSGSESYNLDVDFLDEELIIKIIVFPQTLAESSVLLTIDKELYTYDLEQGSWEAGKEYTYTLGISQDENKLIGIGDSTIEGWEPGEDYDGNLTPVNN